MKIFVNQLLAYLKSTIFQLSIFLFNVLLNKKDEVTGEWRKLHNEELNDIYASPNIVRVIISRRMRLAGHVARMGSVEVYTRLWGENLREKTT
jgi:hypothetical protein